MNFVSVTKVDLSNGCRDTQLICQQCARYCHDHDLDFVLENNDHNTILFIVIFTAIM